MHILLLLFQSSVTRKVCFPTSFDNIHPSFFLLVLHPHVAGYTSLYLQASGISNVKVALQPQTLSSTAFLSGSGFLAALLAAWSLPASAAPWAMLCCRRRWITGSAGSKKRSPKRSRSDLEGSSKPRAWTMLRSPIAPKPSAKRYENTKRSRSELTSLRRHQYHGRKKWNDWEW